MDISIKSIDLSKFLTTDTDIHSMAAKGWLCIRL